MAHVRKDCLTTPPEWWKHLRPFNKRHVAKAERNAAKHLIQSEINDPDETPEGLGLHNSKPKMRKLRFEKGASVIPVGGYCYDHNGVCPYLDRAENKDDQNNGFCWFTGKGDWLDDSGGLLWDSCKECGINDVEPV